MTCPECGSKDVVLVRKDGIIRLICKACKAEVYYKEENEKVP
jgi:uncharacterized Zn finger protein (UPF0148 family)